MNYRKFLTALAVVGAFAVCAEYGYDRPPVVRYHSAPLSGYTGYYCHSCIYGHDVGIRHKRNVEFTKDGMKFNGKDAVCVFSIPWLYPGRPLSATIVADVTVHELGKRGVIAGRAGWDNSIGIREDGKVFFNCFGKSGKNVKELVSSQSIQAGKRYRIAGVLDCSRDNQTYMELYTNGDLVATGILPEPPFDYSREFYVGGIQLKEDGSVRGPLSCTVHELNFFYKDLTRTEICQLGGNIEKRDWNAYKPVVEYGKSVPDKEITFNGVTAQFIRMPIICESMTLTAKLKINEIPQKISGVIAGRPGFDGVLNIRPDGRFAISVWNAEKTDSLNLASKTIAKVGETYRVTAVQHARNVEIVVSLYVNGKLEAQKAIAGKMYPYGKDFCIKGIPSKDGLRGPLNCELLDCRAWGIAFTPEEAAGL